MSEFLYLLTLCLPLATILLVFSLRYASAVQLARGRLAEEGAWRRIAERATTAQTDTAVALADVRARLTTIEKILKDVG